MNNMREIELVWVCRDCGVRPSVVLSKDNREPLLFGPCECSGWRAIDYTGKSAHEAVLALAAAGFTVVNGVEK